MTPASSQPVPAQKDAPPAPEAKPQVYGSFTQDTLVSLLSAELAGQRNRFDIALDNYVTQAIKTQDPGVSGALIRLPSTWVPISRRWIPR